MTLIELMKTHPFFTVYPDAFSEVFPDLNKALNTYVDNLTIKEDEKTLAVMGPKTYNPAITQEEVKRLTGMAELQHIIARYNEIENEFTQKYEETYNKLPDSYKETYKKQYFTKHPYSFGAANLVHLSMKTTTFGHIQEELQKLTNNSVIKQTGAFWYPKKGFMTWHTNEDNPGYRLYFAYAYEDNMSYFKFVNPETQKIVTSYDRIGWTLRGFRVGRDEKRFWHCVGSNTNRLSLGFNINIDSL